MSTIYKLMNSGVHLIYKVRHHNGHGIHSPFVFSIINDVIEEKLPYYAYNDINIFLQKKGLTDKNEKRNKLIFRVVNRFNPKKILEIGSNNGISTLYLSAYSTNIKYKLVTSDQDIKKLHEGWNRKIDYLSHITEISEKQDLVFLQLDALDLRKDDLAFFLINHTHNESVVIIDGLRTKMTNQRFWKKLIANNNVFISLDLYDIGILFFNKKYYKQNYKLSF